MNTWINPLKGITAKKSDVDAKRNSSIHIAGFPTISRALRFSYSILFLLFFTSCETLDKEPDPPADLMEKSVFIDMVAEQLVIESAIFNTSLDVNKKSISAYMYQEWLDKYHTTPETFQRNVDYYFYSEKEARKMMEEVRKKIQEKSGTTKLQD